MNNRHKVGFALLFIITSTNAYGDQWNSVGVGDIGRCSSYEKNCKAYVDTKYGRITFPKSDDYVFVATIGNKKLVELSGSSINIEKIFSVGTKEIILVAENSGGTACPTTYRIIQLNDHSTFSASGDFGTCSDYYSAHIEQDALVVRMPSYFNPTHLRDLSDREAHEVIQTDEYLYKWANSKLVEIKQEKENANKVVSDNTKESGREIFCYPKPRKAEEGLPVDIENVIKSNRDYKGELITKRMDFNKDGILDWFVATSSYASAVGREGRIYITYKKTDTCSGEGYCYAGSGMRLFLEIAGKSLKCEKQIIEIE